MSAEAPVATVPATPVSKNDRKQASHIVDIIMSVARVKKTLADGAVNGAVKNAVAPYKELRRNYETAKKIFEAGGKTQKVNQQEMVVPLSDDDKKKYNNDISVYMGKVNEIETAIASATTKCFRFASDSNITLAIVCNTLVEELSKIAIKRAQDDNHTIIKPEHIYSGAIKESYLYGLVSQLPLFNKHMSEVNERLANGALEAKLEKAKSAGVDALLKSLPKELKKSVKEFMKAKKTAEAAIKAPAKVVVSQHVETEEGSRFGYYVSGICKHVASGLHTDVRVSAAFKLHVSALLEEFINRIAAFIIAITESGGNKTISHVSIMTAVGLMLTNGIKQHAKYEDGEVISPAAVAAEKTKIKEAKEKKEKYEPKWDTLPKVQGKQLKVTSSFGVNYERFAAIANEKLKRYADHMKGGEKKPENGPVAEVVAPQPTAQPEQPKPSDEL